MGNNKWILEQLKENANSTGVILPIVRVQAALDNANSQAERDSSGLHPSEICKKNWCPRSSWYTLMGFPRPTTSPGFNLLNIFAEGNAIHNKWQTWLWHAGVLRGNWQCRLCDHRWQGAGGTSCPSCGAEAVRYREVPIRNEEYNITGHADGIVAHADGETLIEIKSVGVGTLRFEAPDLFIPYSKGEITIDEMWNRIRKPFPSHLRQANLYMFCTGIHTLSFIYEWKPTQDVKEFTVRFQPEIIDDILTGCADIMAHIEGKRPPMRPMWVDSITHATCKSCPYKNKCWGEDDTDSTDHASDRSGGEVQGQVQPPSTTGVGTPGDTPGPRRVIRR